jgi:hypothetical protein
VAAGTAGLRYSLPVTGAIVVLLVALVISYRQVIEAFPNGGGAYAVSQRHLGRVPSLVAAASLMVDYVLNAAVGVSAGVEALTAAFPSLYSARVWLCLAVLAVITAANMWGIAEAARIFMVPTVAFIAAIFLVIAVGLSRAHPAVALSHALPQATDTVGALLVLKAFASGCSALTGVEAIANSVPQFRKPRAQRAQHTEVALGAILGLMLLGLGELIRRWDALPQPGTTVLAQLTSGAIGHGVGFYVIQLITLVLLALAANTSFGGLPVLAGLLVLLFLSIGRTYARIGAQLQIGKVPPPPLKEPSLVVVPVSGMSRLTAEGVSTAMSLGDDVIAVTVVYTDEADDPDEVPDVDFRAEWEAWRPEVPLLTLRSAHRSLAKPIVSYLQSVEAGDKYHRLVVLIPEVEPSRPWEWVLHNQRGIILERAIRRGTSNVVLCRLRYRLATLIATPAVPDTSGT